MQFQLKQINQIKNRIQQPKNQQLHIQLRLAALHVIYKYETIFRELFNTANILEILDRLEKPINHFQKFKKTSWCIG
jgi:hypothetical protein